MTRHTQCACLALICALVWSQSHRALLEGDLEFLQNTSAHLSQVELHVGEHAAEKRAQLAAESRLHAVRCSSMNPS